MSWGGGNPIPGWLGMSESNSLVRMGLVPDFNSAQGLFAPGSRAVLEDIPKLFEAPQMPPVEPLPNYRADNSAALKNAAKLEAERLRKRKGMKSTILTQDSTLMSGVQTGKAEALGG